MRSVTAAVLFAGLLLNAVSFSGEDNRPKPENDRPAGNRDRRRAEGNPEGGNPQRPGRGPGGPGMEMFGPMMRNMGGPGGVMQMASRMLGLDLEPAGKSKLEDLPLGASRRLILNVPVGGVDTPGGTGAGWKMENVFALNAGQVKQVQALRDAYDAEKKVLEAEIAAQQKVLAEKAAQLRQKFEDRANEILEGADKSAKVKLDAIGREAQQKTAQLAADALKLFDPEDFMQGMALIRTLRDKSFDLARETEDKVLAAVPAESRLRIEEAIRSTAQARAQMGNMLQGRPRKGGEEPPGTQPPPPQPPPAGVEGF